MATPKPINDKTNNTDGKDEHNWQLIAEGDWLVGQSFSLGEYAVLGRDTKCDITIPGTHLSRRHAEFISKDDKLLIRDMGSANGTYVNGRQITETELSSGDRVRFDVLEFRVQGPVVKKVEVTTTPPMSDYQTPSPEKNWKIKPTAVGNRHNTIQISAVKKTANSIGILMAAILAISTLAALAYLFTQL